MAKKQKASGGTKVDASAEIDIGPEALASLVDKLKHDLANSRPNDSKPKKSSKKQKREDRMEKGSKSHDDHPSANKSTASNNGNNERIKAKSGSNQHRPSHSNLHQMSTPNGREKSQVDPHASGKSAGLRHSKEHGHPKKAGASNKHDSTESTASTKKSHRDESLLQDILALGGTEEDLQLIADIDSEEEIVGGFESKSGKKGNISKDDKLRQDLQKQITMLGLSGEFLDGGSDGDELDSDWTDEDSRPSASGETQEKRMSKPTQPEKSHIIDRPLRLSAPAKQEPAAARRQKRANLKLEPNPQWYTIERPPAASNSSPPNSEVIAHLHARGKHLLQAEAEKYMSSSAISSSDRQFLSTIMSAGTQSDRLSALTLQVSASPLHTQKHLDALLAMARKKSRNEAVQAIAALKDLFISNLLPDRKLIYFGKQSGLTSNAKDEDLILWTFEDWLKGCYFQVLQTIEALSTDPLLFVRNHMIQYILELLRDKPEQEQFLLRLLVHKLGDGSKTIAAKTSYFILQLESSHPQMKSIILHEMENLLFLPNTSVHAQYYTVITMNQTVLTSYDTAVANRLIEVYFMLFIKLLRSDSEGTPKPQKNKKGKRGKKRREAVNWDDIPQQKEEVNSKILSAVLTGVNRAFPYSNTESDVFEKHMDVLFMITHDANFNTAIQALILIHQVATAKQILLDRYYRTLYESLLDRRLMTSSKQALYLNLLFKSLKSDTNIPRVKAFIKRICQIASIHSPGFICGTLFLLAELTASRRELRSLWANSSQPSEYDARKRDPLYANAEAASLWELSPLLNHYHPTVQVYTKNLLHAQPNTTKPDLALHTVKHFLDRFVYRNPKQKPSAHGISIMQPLPGADTSLVLGIRGHAKTELAVNSEEWWKQQVDRIKPDEIFFHKFFVAKEEGEVRASGKKRKRAMNGEDGEMDEDEIWEALVKSSKEEGGLRDVDVDDDIEWTSDEQSDDDALDEMNDGMSDIESEEMEEDEVVEGSGDRQAINDFFDDEAEEIEIFEEGEEEKEEILDEEYDSEGEEGLEFGDNASDLLDSDEEVESPAQQKRADGRKKRKLKNLPTFADADEYADMLED